MFDWLAFLLAQEVSLELAHNIETNSCSKGGVHVTFKSGLFMKL